MNNEPAICNDRLPYTWGWCWREERGGELDVGVGGVGRFGGIKHLGEERRGEGLKVC